MSTIALSREQIRGPLEEAGLNITKIGKVRILVDLGDGHLLMVASDEVSAFDWNQSPPVLDKGKILTALSLRGLQFAEKLKLRTHLVTGDWKGIVSRYPQHGLSQFERLLDGRCMLVRKTEPFPVEFVIRGYLVGSGIRDYEKTGAVCGIKLPEGLQIASPLEPPIFTPATKAVGGLHDENISLARAIEILGRRAAMIGMQRSLMLYSAAALWARNRGVALLDTKFEFGRRADGQIILIDEVLTPDSSRFSPAGNVVVGESPESWDKETLRQWLLKKSGWDRDSEPPPLPPIVVEMTRQAYLKAYLHFMGHDFFG